MQALALNTCTGLWNDPLNLFSERDIKEGYAEANCFHFKSAQSRDKNNPGVLDIDSYEFWIWNAVL
jgi:hypothetical protein